MSEIALKIAMDDKSIGRCQFNHTITRCNGGKMVVKIPRDNSEIACVCRRGLRCLRDMYPIVEVLVK